MSLGVILYLDDGNLASEHEHDGHLQEDAEGVPDVVGTELLETLGAVTALEEEGPPDGRLREPLLQPARLPGENDGRERLHRPQHLIQRRHVRVLRLLHRRAVPPAPHRPLSRWPGRRAGEEEHSAVRRGAPRRGEGRVRQRRRRSQRGHFGEYSRYSFSGMRTAEWALDEGSLVGRLNEAGLKYELGAAFAEYLPLARWKTRGFSVFLVLVR
jgi:hypothetical protein